MINRFNRVLILLSVLVMIISTIGVVPVAADDSFQAVLGFADTSWGCQEWGENAYTTVTGDGKYTISWDLTEYDVAAIDAGVFFIDIVDAQNAMELRNKAFELTSLEVTADGKNIPVDLSKVLTGDIEDTGNFRIEIYNQYGKTYNDAPLDPSQVKFSKNLTITFSLRVIDKAVTVPGYADPSHEFDFFIAYGGDKESENDWGWEFYGSLPAHEGITVKNASGRVGDTVTISLAFDSATINSWFFAPCMVVGYGFDQIADIDFEITCRIDGKVVPIDMDADAEGKTWWYEGTGAYSKEECIRLAGGYNEWATKYIDEPGPFSTLEYTITLRSVRTETVVEEPEKEYHVDPYGEYNAYLMLYTPAWKFRDAHDSKYNGIGSDFWGDYLFSTDTWETYGVITDTPIQGNGTYSVSITDFGTIFADDFKTSGQPYFNIIGVSTDIPKSEDIKITDVKLIIDGKVYHRTASAYLDPDSKATCKILIQNIWNADVCDISYYPAPASSLEIQFTVSGFAYDFGGSAPDEPEPTEPVVTEPPVTEPPVTEPPVTEPDATVPAQTLPTEGAVAEEHPQDKQDPDVTEDIEEKEVGFDGTGIVKWIAPVLAGAITLVCVIILIIVYSGINKKPASPDTQQTEIMPKGHEKAQNSLRQDKHQDKA